MQYDLTLVFVCMCICSQCRDKDRCSLVNKMTDGDMAKRLTSHESMMDKFFTGSVCRTSYLLSVRHADSLIG